MAGVRAYGERGAVKAPTGAVLLFLALCVVATLGVGIHMARPWGDNYAYQAASGYVALGTMLLWAVSPLAGLALGMRLLRGSVVARRVFAGGAVLVGLVGVYAYVDAAFLHPDAQGGLAFLFVPLGQWLAVLGLVVVGAGLRYWAPDRH